MWTRVKTFLPIMALNRTRQSTKSFNLKLTDLDKYDKPTEENVVDWVLAGRLSRMAYIKDYEVRRIFIENLDHDSGNWKPPGCPGRKNILCVILYVYFEILLAPKRTFLRYILYYFYKINNS